MCKEEDGCEKQMGASSLQKEPQDLTNKQECYVLPVLYVLCFILVCV